MTNDSLSLELPGRPSTGSARLENSSQNDEINRDSPVPFYFQLAELMEGRIKSGVWEQGTRLPSEPELCEHFGLSRTTVRQALGRLEQEGLISRRKGRGTFVEQSRPRSWLLQSSDGFFQEEVERMNRSVASTLLRVGQGVLPTWASDALGLAHGSSGVTLERVRSVDGSVAMYNVNHLPMDFAETVASLSTGPTDQSLYLLLRDQHGIEVAGGRRHLEAVNAGPQLAELLETTPDAPLVFVESVSWDSNMRPFDVYQSWLRTDRIRIDIEVAASGRP